MTIYEEWQKKLKDAKTEKEKEICKTMMAKFQPVIQEPSEYPEKVKTYHTHFGEVTWYVNEKIIECQGAKFTDEEILKLKSRGLHVTNFELELKRQLPHITLIDISEVAA